MTAPASGVAGLMAAREKAGLPRTVTDPDALDRIAKVLATSEPESKGEAA